jgi:hypothetical protein
VPVCPQQTRLIQALILGLDMKHFLRLGPPERQALLRYVHRCPHSNAISCLLSAHKSGTPNIGEERIVRVFSNTIMDFVEEPAIFVDRQENWISKDLVERLGLTPRPDENAPAKLSNLDGKLFRFKGTVTISCCWKDPPLHRHPVPVTCHIVPSAMPHIMLKASFCATPDPPSKLAAPLEVVPSISSTPLLSGQFPFASGHPASTAAETTQAIPTRSIASDETLVSDLNGSGIIDSFIGEFYTENSNEYAKTHFD